MMRTPELVMNLLARLRQHSATAASLTPEQEGVAQWIRGNEPVAMSIDRLLRRRIEDRADLPLSSNPDEAVLLRARDKECREILALFHALCQAPVNLDGRDEEVSGIN